MTLDQKTAAGHKAGTYYPALDGVRGVAVAVVMLLHFTLFDPNGVFERGLRQMLNTGWIGVDLFFVLSGFLITGILIDSRDRERYFVNFYARRTLRIFPLYYVYLFLLFVVLPLVSADYAAEHAVDDRRIWLWTYLGNVLMGMGGWEGMPSHTTHLWSLAVEEQFYLVWPFLVYLVPRKRLGWLCAATFGGAVVTRMIIAYLEAWPAGYVLTPARMDTLAAGAAIAVVLRSHGPEAVRRLTLKFAVAGAALLTFGIAWSFSHGEYQLLAPLDFGTEQFAYPGIALLFAALIGRIVTAKQDSTLVAAFSLPTLRTLGKYSYALYLIHVPLRNISMIALDRLGGLPSIGGSQLPAQVALTSAGLATSMALALLSWHLVEKRFLMLKRHFAGHGAPAPPAAEQKAVQPA